MKVTVRHKDCGGLLGHYHCEIGDDISVFESKKFTFVNGENPNPNALLKTLCPKCLMLITGAPQMERCFEEVDDAEDIGKIKFGVLNWKRNS